MIDRQTVSQMVAEELARPEVHSGLAKIRPAPSLSDRIGNSLRHPLSITTFGFVMTYFVGAGIENQLAESDKLAQEREILTERAFKLEAQTELLVRDFVELVYRRSIEGNMLRSAIQRRSTPELLQRKADYDAVYRQWNELQPWRLFSLRHVWAGEDRALLAQESPYEATVRDYIEADFAFIDSCVTRNFDVVVRSVLSDDTIANVPGDYCADADWAAKVRAASYRTRTCASKIMAVSLEALRDRTNRKIHGEFGSEDAGPAPGIAENELQLRLEEACGAPDGPVENTEATSFSGSSPDLNE